MPRLLVLALALSACGKVTVLEADAGRAGDAAAAELGQEHDAGGELEAHDAGPRVLVFNCAADGGTTIPGSATIEGQVTTVCNSATQCRAAICLAPASSLIPGLGQNASLLPPGFSVAGYDLVQLVGCGAGSIASSCPPLADGSRYTAVCVASCSP